MKKGLLLFCMLSAMLVVHAQSTGEIGGIVSDTLTGEPLIFANLSLEKDGVIISQTSADAYGKYMFSQVKEGIYTLVVSYVGYGTRTFDNVRVNNRELTIYNLPLMSGYEITTFYVFPDIILKTPIIGDVIDIKEIKHMGTRSAGEMVAQTVAGVYSSDGGEGGGLYISGARADATLFVVDGVRVIGSTYVPKSAIANITVHTGGIPANYGDVTGGVIEITTRTYDGIW